MPITLTAKPLDARAWLKKILHDVAFALIRSVDGGLFGVSWAIDWRLNPKLSRLRKLNYWSRIAIVLREGNRREEKNFILKYLSLNYFECIWEPAAVRNLAESYINVKFDNCGFISLLASLMLFFHLLIAIIKFIYLFIALTWRIPPKVLCPEQGSLCKQTTKSLLFQTSWCIKPLGINADQILQ